ncbi:inorganic phosphate transporter [Thermopolyspora sp. NPDC052614]|uniref:inorganic phosphate transporter n=1 Tax=Thermopolyspora sp. NPDC052614 TaxID=3155682 RepID=UPI003438BE6D
MPAFALAAIAFVLISGANDGATLIGLGLRFPAVPGWLIASLLVAVLFAGPYLMGIAVARTFTERLVAFGAAGGAATFLAGVVIAVVVVAVLTARGLPTSLTLALIGAITGVGLGAGLPVSWAGLGVVLAAGVAAPFAGLLLGYLFGSLSQRVPSYRRMPRLVRAAHVLAYGVQSVAYAANDGQKMIAVVGVAIASAAGPGGIGEIHVPPPWMAALTALFFAGALTSLTRVGERLGRGLAITRPPHIVCAEMAATGAVLGSVALGCPVSITQSIAAGVVGVAAREGLARVRWQHVANIVVAWLVTLPVSMTLAVLAGLALRAAGGLR